MEGKKMCELPPGFRFHPTDEELIVYYLRNQMVSRTCPISIISELDIYKFDPWELPEKADFGENEWYFFTPRNRKYPNGVRPNRATTSGYWKATGTDKSIHSDSKYVGVRKTLVFYKGRPPKGVKSDWIMNEYRLGDSNKQPTKQNGSMRLDDWVLCRIYKKGHSKRTYDETSSPRDDSCSDQAAGTIISSRLADVISTDQESLTCNLPRIFSFGHLLEIDDDQYRSLSHLLSENNVFNY